MPANKKCNHDSILTTRLKVIVYILCYLERVFINKKHRQEHLRDVMMGEGWLPRVGGRKF
jgi:hypothetical protein